MNELQSKYENQIRSIKRGTNTATTTATTTSNNNMVITNQNSTSNSGISSSSGVMKVGDNYDVKHDDSKRIDKSLHHEEISRVTSLYANKLNIIEKELNIANDEIIKYKNEIQIYKSIINNSTTATSNSNSNNNDINSSNSSKNNSNSNSSYNNDNLHNIITENNLKFENEKTNLQEFYENRLEDMRRSHTNYSEQMTSLWKQEREKLHEQLQKEENRCQDLRLELMKVITTAASASTTTTNNKSDKRIMSIELNHFQVFFLYVM